MDDGGDTAWGGDVTESGERVSACGLSCIFCGASITVHHDGRMEHNPEHPCPSWVTHFTHLRGVYREMAAVRMKGCVGWFWARVRK